MRCYRKKNIQEQCSRVAFQIRSESEEKKKDFSKIKQTLHAADNRHTPTVLF